MGIEVLPAADSILWGVQRPEAPLQIAGLALFEGGPLRDEGGRLRLDELRERVGATLAATPRFRRRLTTLPFGIGAAWVDDDGFAVEHHVTATTLAPPGGEPELREEVARLVGRPLDRRRPLWAITLIDGVADGRVALLIEASHVLLDGMALLDLAFRLLDADVDAHAAAAADVDPAAPSAPTPSGPWRAEPAPSPLGLTIAAVGERARQVGAALNELMRLAAYPQVLTGVAGLTGGAVRSGLRLLASGPKPSPPRPPLTGRVAGRRAVAWTRLPLDDVRSVAHRSGTTVNDVVLALTAGALGHYMEVHPQDPAPAEARVIVPLSIHAGTADEVENRFGVVLARVPVGLDDPGRDLQALHRQLDRVKGGAGSSVGARVFALAGLLPPWLVQCGGRAALDRQSAADLAVTDLHGPERPYRLLGARMLEVHPLVTGTGNIATIIGVLSYHGGLGVCATVDADVVPDPQVLIDGYPEALHRLLAAHPG